MTEQLALLSSVVVAQFPEVGSALLNGRYNIAAQRVNGRPHFIKALPVSSSGFGGFGGDGGDFGGGGGGGGGGGIADISSAFGQRRHLFYSSQKSAWVIAARCDDSEGVLASLATSSINALQEGTLDWRFNVAAAEGRRNQQARESSAVSGVSGIRGELAHLVEEQAAREVWAEESGLTITPLSAAEAERDFGMEAVAPSERYKLERPTDYEDDDDDDDDATAAAVAGAAGGGGGGVGGGGIAGNLGGVGGAGGGGAGGGAGAG